MRTESRQRERRKEQGDRRKKVFGKNRWLEFRGSRIHGIGAYARKFIPRGTYVIQYLGEFVGKRESRRRCRQANPYIFTFNRKWDLDGNDESNLARWINHSCETNCEAIVEDGAIWFVALRDIRPGEEFCFDYGYGFVGHKSQPCRCGSSRCVGYIVARRFHKRLRRNVGRRRPSRSARRKRVATA